MLEGPRLSEVVVDADRIRQVMENLLSNAGKYSFPATPIRIRLLERDNETEVVVTNRGPGIPADEMAILFSRFVCSREVRKGTVPGLGLGLYISHGLIEAQGGRMWAESVPDQETSFHFTVRRYSPSPLAQ